MTDHKIIYIVAAEYQAGENDLGVEPGDDHCVMVAAFEDARDADAFLDGERARGFWGDFRPKSGDASVGWSDHGWWLEVRELGLTLSSRKENPNKKKSKVQADDGSRGKSALYAGLGSVGGRFAGALVGGPALAAAGSVLGAMWGGGAGAPQDRQRRSQLGSGLGAVFLGPIGAAIGSYIGTRLPDRKRRLNPWERKLGASSSKDRAEVGRLLRQISRAHVNASLADARGDHAAATRWQKKRVEYDRELRRMEERLQLFTPESSANPSRSVKRRLMGGAK
jgi:hypothetical protein